MNLLVKAILVACLGYASCYLRPFIEKAIESEDSRVLARHATGCILLQPAWVLIDDELKEMSGRKRTLVAFNLTLVAYGLGVALKYVVEVVRSK
jgi:hypothetical protein